jgi:hypothetical protein
VVASNVWVGWAVVAVWVAVAGAVLTALRGARRTRVAMILARRQERAVRRTLAYLRG